MATNTNTNQAPATAAAQPTTNMAKAKAKAATAAAALTPAQTKAATATKVQHMRNVQLLSWRAIGGQLGFSPKTARAYYQLAAGAHQHHGLLPGKGGRLPANYVAAAASATALVQPGTAPWVPVAQAGRTGVAGTKGGALAAPPAAPAPKAKAPRKPRATKAPAQ